MLILELQINPISNQNECIFHNLILCNTDSTFQKYNFNWQSLQKSSNQ